jgi:hypothetical protein
MKSTSRQGVIYFANNEYYLAEAVASAQSVKANNSKMPCLLFSNQPFQASVFDEIIPLALTPLKGIDQIRQSFLDRIQAMLQTPFEQTLFLDTDTYICSSLQPLFDLLNRFEFGIAHAPIRISDPEPTVSEAFPEPNAGVILFQKNRKVKKLLKNWYDLYQKALLEKNPLFDQASLRKALYFSPIQLTILPPEYNCRFCYPTALGRDAVILHGRCENYSDLAIQINQEKGKRAFRYHQSQLQWIYNTKE